MHTRFLAVAALALLVGLAPIEPAHAQSPWAQRVVHTGVVVNGRELSPEQYVAFAQAYGTPPQPGAWWYDARSGQFGAVGQMVGGVLRPGHDLGPLAADASRGTSGVFLNGRQLPHAEVVMYSAWVGPVAPGRYWLDAQGNVGVEGASTPVTNLVVAAQAAGMRSGGGGAGGWLSGNEWSGRMSSGTWDTSGQGNHVISVDGEVLNLP